MLEVSIERSNNIIRKGDYFNIYIDVFNSYDNPITIKEIKLDCPIGFIPLKGDKELSVMQTSIMRGILSFFGEFFGRDIEITSFSFKLKTQKNQ